MSEPRMPQTMIDWMSDRNWGMHHLQWHFVRQWDLQSPANITWASSQGWSRAAQQEGDPGNGLEFLVMHRAMIRLLRRDFSTQLALLQGWTNVPTDPNDSLDPVPAVNPRRAFAANMSTAVGQLNSNTFLASLADDDSFGLYLETSKRPGGFSSDTTTGLHNYMHGRFSVPGDPVDLGDPEINLGNQRFWRLHGWIDARWSSFRAAKGLSAMDASLQALIDAEMLHLDQTHHTHHGMLLASSTVSSTASASTSSASTATDSTLSIPLAAFNAPALATADDATDSMRSGRLLSLAKHVNSSPRSAVRVTDRVAATPSTVSDGLCRSVGKGGVGESGATQLLTHRVAGSDQKVIVLTVVESSLCANQSVVAAILVNGVAIMTKRLSAKGETLQTTVSSGTEVAAILHMVPLFNGIQCVRLGELSVELRECDLAFLTSDGHSGVNTRHWYAWNDTQPPKPSALHLIGEVEVANPGVIPTLVPRVPQGFNPRILLLDLHLVQSPGIWPQIVVWKQASHMQIHADYDSVSIFFEGNVIADLPVKRVS